MRDEELAKLAERIRQELGEISRVVTRTSEGWERLFAQIAEVVEGDLPHGENWHQLLLRRMMTEVPMIRPAVISKETSAKLDDYRGFRHVVRNVYAYKFDPDKLEKLVRSVPDLFAQLKAELLAFASFLDQ